MYFVTTITKTGDDYRCVGYFKEKADAEKVVTHNYGDIFEAGLYPYAVIENIRPGLYQYDQRPLWYKYDAKSDGYLRTKKPEFIDNHLVGFAIG